MDDEPVQLQIGDFVTWRSRLCVLRGIGPMSVAERRAELEDCLSGERLRAPLADLAPAPETAG